MTTAGKLALTALALLILAVIFGMQIESRLTRRGRKRLRLASWGTLFTSLGFFIASIWVAP